MLPTDVLTRFGFRKPRSALPRIHLLNTLRNPTGGSEWRTVELYRLLQPHARVTAWSMRAAHPALIRQIPIRRLRNLPGRRPRGGTLVIVGAYFRIRSWLRHVQADRIVIIYNLDEPESLERRLGEIRALTSVPVVVAFASEELRRRSGWTGPVLPSPIDLARFRPGLSRRWTSDSAVVVGRCSRDVPFKHHPNDRALYSELSAEGFRVRCMGATCLYRENPPPRGVEIQAAGAMDAAEFLRGLDVFLYRTDPVFFETFGRVVFEAMACGLPVVCGSPGGHVEHIEHGKTGYVFRDDAEAFEILRLLRDDPALREQVGASARSYVENLYRTSNEYTLLQLLGTRAGPEAR